MSGAGSKEEMKGMYKEMRLREARQYLIPHVNKMRDETGSAQASKQPPKLKDLQQLAVHWGLNKKPGFWSEYSEVRCAGPSFGSGSSVAPRLGRAGADAPPSPSAWLKPRRKSESDF